MQKPLHKFLMNNQQSKEKTANGIMDFVWLSFMCEFRTIENIKIIS